MHSQGICDVPANQKDMSVLSGRRTRDVPYDGKPYRMKKVNVRCGLKYKFVENLPHGRDILG